MKHDEKIQAHLKHVREGAFKNHVATLGILAPVQQLTWANPHSSIYRISYTIIDGYVLCVSGDAGDAVFGFGGGNDFGFDWLASTDCHYFMGKLRASRFGAEGKQWIEDVAKEWLENFLVDRARQICDELGFKQNTKTIAFCRALMKQCTDKDEFTKIVKRFNREPNDLAYLLPHVGDDPFDWLESGHSWTQFLDDNGYAFFGDEYYEHSSIGMSRDLSFFTMHEGLKMATQQLKLTPA